MRQQAKLSIVARVLRAGIALEGASLVVLILSLVVGSTQGASGGAIEVLILGWVGLSLLLGLISTLGLVATEPKSSLTIAVTVCHLPFVMYFGYRGFKQWKDERDMDTWVQCNKEFSELIETRRYREADAFLRDHSEWEFDVNRWDLHEVLEPRASDGPDLVALVRRLQARGLHHDVLVDIAEHAGDSAFAFLLREGFVGIGELTEEPFKVPEVLCPKDRSAPDSEVLRRMGERGNWQGGDLLYQAARCSLAAVEVVLGMGVPVTAVSSKGRTALVAAANVQIASFLVEHGVNVDARDHNGATALMLHHTPDFTKYLLEHGADPKAVDKDGYSALHYILSDQPLKERFELLLTAGADPNAKSKLGSTPLSSMASKDWWDQEAADVLVKHGADPRRPGKAILAQLIRRDINITPSLGWPGLDLGGQGGAELLLAAMDPLDPVVIKQLLDAGANPSVPDEHGEVPLEYYRHHFRPDEPPTEEYKALVEAAERLRRPGAGL